MDAIGGGGVEADPEVAQQAFRSRDLRDDGLMVEDGIAKPTPSLPPESLLICVLTPMTCPLELSSGPPSFRG